jgi:pimeloyl-ACP methyl ester carboxylesterase
VELHAGRVCLAWLPLAAHLGGTVTNRQARHATAVLVHGGFLGPWIWPDTIRLLEARGVRSVTVDLPSSQDSSDHLPGLHDDAEAVRDALNGCTDAVLCGHSYAGAMISEAAAGPHRAVRHLVFLAAAVPDAGDSLTSLAEAAAKDNPTETDEESGGEEIDMRADGRMIMRPESARAALFHDCSPDRRHRDHAAPAADPGHWHAASHRGRLARHSVHLYPVHQRPAALRTHQPCLLGARKPRAHPARGSLPPVEHARPRRGPAVANHQ